MYNSILPCRCIMHSVCICYYLRVCCNFHNVPCLYFLLVWLSDTGDYCWPYLLSVEASRFHIVITRFANPLILSFCFSFSFVFWIGDLNYRLSDIDHNKALSLIEKQEYHKLMNYDQVCITGWWTMIRSVSQADELWSGQWHKLINYDQVSVTSW